MVKHYLPMEANTIEEVTQYYRVRFAEIGDRRTPLIREDSNGVFRTKIKYNGEEFDSIYIPEGLRGKGLIKKYINLNFITMPDCDMEEIITGIGGQVMVVKGWPEYSEYSLIKEFYGDKKSKRSGEFLMWHITRGCQLLQQMGASENAIKAYMLHPIFQGDKEFSENWKELLSGRYPDEVVRNVIEYRKLANSFLCKSYTDNWTYDEFLEAVPFIFKDVWYMLAADKVQNREDFLKFHKESHPRSKELENYFDKWLVFLNKVKKSLF